MKLKYLVIFNTLCLFLNIITNNTEPSILSWGRKASLWDGRTSECSFCVKFDFLLMVLFAIIFIVISYS